MWGEYLDPGDGTKSEDGGDPCTTSRAPAQQLGLTFFSSDDVKGNEAGGFLYVGDPILLNIVELLQYKRRVQSRRAGKDTHIPDLPDWTKRERPPLLSPSNGSDLPEEVVHKLLRKSMASFVAYAGFVEVEDEALESMTDIAEEFMQRLCALLHLIESRSAVEIDLSQSTPMAKSSNFLNAIVQTLRLVGIPHPSAVLEDYDLRVRGYHRRLLDQCKELKRRKDAEPNQPLPTLTSSDAKLGV